MKITIAEAKKEEELKFPCLMVNEDGTIVLASNFKDGLFSAFILVSKTDCINAGEYHRKWDVTFFKPFHGSITLSNED